MSYSRQCCRYGLVIRLYTGLAGLGLADLRDVIETCFHSTMSSSGQPEYPALPCPALPCPALPCPALPCPALPCPALPCPALPCPALPCPALPCPALPCPALPPALPCPALPCPALPCPALPCPALPCPALPCPADAAVAGSTVVFRVLLTPLCPCHTRGDGLPSPCITILLVCLLSLFHFY